MKKTHTKKRWGLHNITKTCSMCWLTHREGVCFIKCGFMDIKIIICLLWDFRNWYLYKYKWIQEDRQRNGDNMMNVSLKNFAVHAIDSVNTGRLKCMSFFYEVQLNWMFSMKSYVYFFWLACWSVNLKLSWHTDLNWCSLRQCAVSRVSEFSLTFEFVFWQCKFSSAVASWMHHTLFTAYTTDWSINT